jgi:hypothetical protein
MPDSTGFPAVVALVSPDIIKAIPQVVAQVSREILNDIGAAGKLAPLAQPLAKLIGKQVDTEVALKEAGTKVLKLSDAIQIVQTNVNKFQELADVTRILAVAPGTEGVPDLQTRIIEEMKQKVLSQNRPIMFVRSRHGTRRRFHDRSNPGAAGNFG